MCKSFWQHFLPLQVRSAVEHFKLHYVPGDTTVDITLERLEVEEGARRTISKKYLDMRAPDIQHFVFNVTRTPQHGQIGKTSNESILILVCSKWFAHLQRFWRPIKWTSCVPTQRFSRRTRYRRRGSCTSTTIRSLVATPSISWPRRPRSACEAMTSSTLASSIFMWCLRMTRPPRR